MERYHLFAYPPASAAGTFGFGLIFGFVLDSIAKIPWAWLHFCLQQATLFGGNMRLDMLYDGNDSWILLFGYSD
jgi:hypothetical protein